MRRSRAILRAITIVARTFRLLTGMSNITDGRTPALFRREIHQVADRNRVTQQSGRCVAAGKNLFQQHLESVTVCFDQMVI